MSEQESKGTHYVMVTIGARTERGGVVTTGSAEHNFHGLAFARVGDIVTYADGSEAVIADGAGDSLIDYQPAALIGSNLSNGDRIISTIFDGAQIFVPEGTVKPGLFDPDYVPPAREPLPRFAVAGSTTARGGMLRDVSSDRDVDDTNRKAGSIGDFVEYADGTRARIITGIGLPGNERLRYAVVGSLLDNGDVITDSPHREPRTATIFVPIDEHGAALTRQ